MFAKPTRIGILSILAVGIVLGYIAARSSTAPLGSAEASQTGKKTEARSYPSPVKAQHLKIRCGARSAIGYPSGATPKLPDIVTLKHLDGSTHPMLISTKRLDVEMV